MVDALTSQTRSRFHKIAQADSRAMPPPICTLGGRLRWLIVWTRFQMESQKNVWPVSPPPGPTASWYVGLLFGHTTVSLDDHDKPQHLQDAPQQSHLLWREPHLLPTKQEEDGWKPSVRTTPHNSCGHKSFLRAAPIGFQILSNCFSSQENNFQAVSDPFFCLLCVFPFDGISSSTWEPCPGDVPWNGI